MKRFLTVALMGVLALGLSSAVFANVCAFDAVPAATLLFPFVPYDYDGGTEGQTTLFSITNVSDEAQIVHVTIWTDYSVAILDFNVLLTGYDVITMNIRDIMGSGILPGPLTGDTIWEYNNDGASPFDDGPVSSINELYNPNLSYMNGLLPDPEETRIYLDCDPVTWLSSPNNYTEVIPASIVNTFRGYVESSMTVSRSYLNCSGAPTSITDPVTGLPPWFITRDDGPAWMYITADVVNTCNKDLPDSDGLSYFSPATISYANVLVGDQIWMNAGNSFSEADNAVHLEASQFYPSFTLTDNGDATTFYHRYTVDAGGVQAFSDFREPLPTAWHMRYQWNPSASINTWIRAWKGGTDFAIVEDLDAGLSGAAATYLDADSCLAYTYYAWDMDENVNSVTSDEFPWSGGPDDPVRPVPNLFPLETQEVEVDQLFLVGESDGDAFGWLLFVWPRSNTDIVGGTLLVDQYQTWMGVKYSGFGSYTAAMSGAVMANYNCDDTQVLPQLGLGLYYIPQ